jgi:uncharacterized protein (DUF983 family)
MSDQSVSAFKAGLFGRCPKCGQGKLYKGFINLDERCASCGLDYDFADSGDGPAIFIMLIVGFLVVGLAIWVEVTYRPPYYVHALLWLPGVIILSALLLRPLKALLIALQYKHQAKEGRLEK